MAQKSESFPFYNQLFKRRDFFSDIYILIDNLQEEKV